MATIEADSRDLKLARRKLPRQQRARNTVDSILQATEALVKTHGFTNIGTRLIAETAGVTIGSLYQYFPTYESILLAWYENVVNGIFQRFNVAAISVIHDETKRATKVTTTELFRHLESHSLVLIHMPREVPQIERAIKAISFENLLGSAIRRYFQLHPEYLAKDLDRHVFFLETIVIGSMRRYLLETPSYLSRKEFLSRLSRIILLYLEANKIR